MTNTSIESKLPTIEKSELFAEKNGLKIELLYLRHPSGEGYEYTTFVTHKQAVMVLAETPEGLFVMNEEYRCPTRKVLLSLPGGCVDEGEKPEEAAPRELFEETGYKAERFIFLGKSHPSPGNNPQETFYYLAKGAKKTSDPTPELCEIFETREMTLEEIHKRLLKAENLDGHVTTALYFKLIRNV
jgi:ADP-ribose pyrophosphatase